MLDRKYEVYGKDINVIVNLDSDIYNLVYEIKIEFRENNILFFLIIMFKVNMFFNYCYKRFLFLRNEFNIY